MAENWADTTRTVEFQKSVEFQLNETPGKLISLVGSSKGYSSKKAEIVDRFDDLYAEEIDERNGDTKNTDPNVERRWIVKPKRASVAPLLDPDDTMSTEVDIKSPLAVGVAKAIRRYQDDKFLEGFYGTAYTGEEGATGVPFKSANIIPVDYSTTGTDTGLTLNKLIRCQEAMEEALVDLEAETPVMIYTAKQKSDLLKLAQIQSRDFNPMATQALQDGKVTSFMGFMFVPAQIGNAKAYKRSSALTLASAGVRSLPFFVRSGLHKGTWLDFEAHIDLRADKNHSTQIAGYTCAAVTRLDEDKCFQVLCKES